MCPSTEVTGAQREFAADVLRKLLRRIDDENKKGRDPYLVSHAWTEGPIMYLVYKTPPSDRTWGLARDTRQSIVLVFPAARRTRHHLVVRISARRSPSAPVRHPRGVSVYAIDRSAIGGARPRPRSVRYQRAPALWKSAMS